ncbi:hypothetical protein [Photobacterium sp. 53610]|uniref:hypothetical protein n=1 Tax=Photobacterium sp. 53610 TaxID=3102789 RepID=UPI002ED93B90
MSNNNFNTNTLRHLKWLYSGMLGFSASYFLVLLSGYVQLSESKMLTISTILFSIALPLFFILALFHILVEESNTSPEIVQALTETSIADKMTKTAFYSVFLAFVFLIGHYSEVAFFTFLTSSAIGFYFAAPTFRKLVEANKQEPNFNMNLISFSIDYVDTNGMNIQYHGHKY